MLCTTCQLWQNTFHSVFKHLWYRLNLICLFCQRRNSLLVSEEFCHQSCPVAGLGSEPKKGLLGPPLLPVWVLSCLSYTLYHLTILDLHPVPPGQFYIWIKNRVLEKSQGWVFRSLPLLSESEGENICSVWLSHHPVCVSIIKDLSWAMVLGVTWRETGSTDGRDRPSHLCGMAWKQNQKADAEGGLFLPLRSSEMNWRPVSECEESNTFMPTIWVALSLWGMVLLSLVRGDHLPQLFQHFRQGILADFFVLINHWVSLFCQVPWFV